MPFFTWEEYAFSRNFQNNLDDRPVAFSKAPHETFMKQPYRHIAGA